ncbi:MAG: hypothetical protein D4R74_12065 [Betaproteobacteria bacterium]|nr:MAG: hypothetical protein D4R74_12065 [Betaproteobacteria bacterium]
MKTPVAVLFLAFAAAFVGNAQATPLEEIHGLPVSRLEFSSLKLEFALAGIKDWPFPIEGAGISFKVNPDQIDIVVAVKITRDEPFRAACVRTVTRVRELLYVNAEGNASMGRSSLGTYFRGPWQGPQREAALRALDASTRIQVDVVKRGSCQAALVKAPVTFEETSPK